MTFHPIWPLALIALLAVAWFARTALQARRPGDAEKNPKQDLGRQTQRRHWRRLAMAILVLLMAVRPVAGAAAGAGASSQADILLVVDRTISMRAEDYNGSKQRIQGVREDVRRIIENSPGARFSVISFDSSPQVETPFTTDTTAIFTLIDSLPTQSHYYAEGSSISSAVPLIVKTLTDAQKSAPERMRHVVYLGDGEHTLDTPVDSFDEVKSLTSGGAVLGYGTSEGGKMKRAAGGEKDEGYVPDEDYEDAVSRIDEANLEGIAGDLGVEYEHRTEPGPVAFTPQTTFGASLGSSTVSSGFELYWIFAIGLFALSLWELWGVGSTYRQLRRELR